jgi:PKD repeat protein
MKKSVTILFLFFAGIAACPAQIPATTKEAFFKDWNYSPTGVFGLIKLNDLTERSYYKIIKTDPQTTKVYAYNPAGVQTSTLTFRFANGKITQMARTDRWGDTYEVTKFTASGADQFTVTRKNSGKNSFFPSKAALYIFKLGLLTEVRYLDFNNKIAPGSDGVAIIKYKRYSDKIRYSLAEQAAYYDETGKPVISQSSDYHKIIYEYDNMGNQVSYAYFGTSNEPLTNRFGGFKRKSEYDPNDHLIRGVSFGLNDEPVANSYGVAGTVYEYKNGLTSKSTRFDQNFKTTKASAAGDGVAIIKYEYDERGNETKRSYFDENDQAINGQSGYHSITYTYDPLDMMTSESYYDKYGSRTTNRDSIHKYVYERDDKGRTIQKAYYDNNNNTVKDPSDEVYMVKYKYDQQGREVSESYWKNNTTKMQRWNGYHEELTKYNEDGLETEYAFYDENGKLYISSSGYSRVMNLYSPDARIIERKYMNGNDGIEMKESFVNGFCSVKFSYDIAGRVNAIRYFDAAGLPVNATSYLNEEDLVFHKIEFIYTGNRITEEKLYLKDSDTPGKIIDCLKNNYISTGGVSQGYKNR